MSEIFAALQAEIASVTIARRVGRIAELVSEWLATKPKPSSASWNMSNGIDTASSKPYSLPPSPFAPDFRRCHEPVGDFPEVDIGLKWLGVRVFTAFGSGLSPIL